MSSLHNTDTQWHFARCCTVHQRDPKNMLSASMDTFDSHFTHAALAQECQHTSQSSQAGSVLLRLFIKTKPYITSNLKLLLPFDRQHLLHARRKSQVTQLKWVWLNKGDIVPLTFSISLWRRQAKGSSQQIGPKGTMKAKPVKLISKYVTTMDTSVRYRQTHLV